MRDDAAKRIEIAGAAQLALFAHEVNQGTSFAGYTVVLTQDIDLSGHLWYPIGDVRDTDSVAARTQFTVKSSDVQVPATGDTAMFLPMVCAMFVLTGIGAAGVFVSRKKAQ